ncbi:MAG: UDP-N-acetylmuramoyl-tripeptide--D-alanyl-D-alanine ligase [Flaviaesturariibacter sp.]|nr:UDP-N-acetylmuramoyl-tripeptide--D-alanyl-D-alanine ligase [Flaviaesturariibacter sp.]
MPIADLYALYLQHPVVETDTRKLTQGSLYFALRGPNFNGNAFVAKALENGAVACVIDEEQYAVPGKTILVPDALTALQELAAHHRNQFTIPFLAITGSNGKTTTKELIHAVLSTTYRTYTTEGNLNNHIGVPLTILKIRGDAGMAIIEMGANHRGEIASYCRIARPTHGLITNCGKAHLEGFGGEEGVRKGKGELFDSLRESGGTAFLMADYDYLKNMSEGITRTVSYGTATGDVTGTALRSDPFLDVQLVQPAERRIATQLVGAYNLPNVLAAVAVGTFFDVPMDRLVDALQGYTPSNSRSQLVRKAGHTVILDAYNANPSSMKLAIENFARAEGGPKVLVLGAMAELGPQSLAEHEAIVSQIGQSAWAEVVLVGGDFQKLSHAYRGFATASGAGEWLRSNLPSNSCLLVKGSRSAGMEKVLDYL